MVACVTIQSPQMTSKCLLWNAVLQQDTFSLNEFCKKEKGRNSWEENRELLGKEDIMKKKGRIRKLREDPSKKQSLQVHSIADSGSLAVCSSILVFIATQTFVIKLVMPLTSSALAISMSNRYCYFSFKQLKVLLICFLNLNVVKV